MKLSARNMFKGTILSVEKGIITAKVKIDIGGGNTVTSIISKDSVEELDLKTGDKAYAIIKSTEVLVAKD
jgi:molybdopterin-binding protein